MCQILIRLVSIKSSLELFLLKILIHDLLIISLLSEAHDQGSCPKQFKTFFQSLKLLMNMIHWRLVYMTTKMRCFRVRLASWYEHVKTLSKPTYLALRIFIVMLTTPLNIIQFAETSSINVNSFPATLSLFISHLISLLISQLSVLTWAWVLPVPLKQEVETAQAQVQKFCSTFTCQK